MSKLGLALVSVALGLVVTTCSFAQTDTTNDVSLVKLQGTDSIEGDNLQLSCYNGTAWNVKEITVGLTILRRSERQTAQYGSARLITAAETTPAAAQPEKHSDVTILYHLKGAAAPFKTTVFKETLGATLGSDQDWHWAIVQAKGVPPAPKDPPPTTPAVTP